TFTTDGAQRQLVALVGDAHVALVCDERSEAKRHALVVAPANVAEAREVMLLAAREGWSVVPAGACTWLDAGNPLTRANVLITTRRMTRLIRHEPADLVATVEAGMTFAAFNETTSR